MLLRPLTEAKNTIEHNIAAQEHAHSVHNITGLLANNASTIRAPFFPVVTQVLSPSTCLEEMPSIPRSQCPLEEIDVPLEGAAL